MNQKIPQRIARLDELANNLWWSWHEQPRWLFSSLDYQLWRLSDHNPVRLLSEVSPDILQAAAIDRAFLALYDSVMSEFDAEMSPSKPTWFTATYPDMAHSPIAYFSMEYAMHNSLPIYAGGLGVLAGDVCKEASDLGLPMVAVGFMYPQGYFHQHVSIDGWQEEIYRQLDFDQAPINRVLSPRDGTTIARIQLGDDTVAIEVWQVQVGRVSIYLLDTNLEQNSPQYRELSARLYIADRDLRLQQEIVLGIGGVRVLRALGINPLVWHANEGHISFMMLERIRELVAAGATFAEAEAKVRAATAFTTHTPVPAGHDIFPVQLIEKYLSRYWPSLGIDRQTFLRLGQKDDSMAQEFNMTALSLKLSGYRSAVSQLHGKVARKMWRGLWPQLSEDQLPIAHVTNGIHVCTWVAREMYHLFERYLGEDWIQKHDDSRLWEHVLDIPDEELWAVHQDVKRKLLSVIRERARERWVEDNIPPRQLLTMGVLLNPEALTIAFARRFTEYKRPALIFRDIDRLKRIVTNQWHPVQILFAGKSHPADFLSKRLMQQVYALASDPEFQGRIAFIEDYDVHVAHYLTQGVDVWLNTPRRGQEACGTSGMKAALNGALHLSVRDGWWYEGYNGTNGWAIGDDFAASTTEEEDVADAEALYRLLEGKIVPLYYSRDRRGLPHGWTRMVKESIRSIVPVFCARRMLKEYTERMYIPAARLAVEAQRVKT
ncbi:MAG: alpha-glucan family phosphorylase [Chloroflexi bacterium]|nr:alpha-glucan family phosphorylase [Chloroflexota bacterium]